VIETLAEDLAGATPGGPRTFRAAADRVRQRTGRKEGAAASVRLALTAATEGPELDVLIPRSIAFDRGADSGPAPIIGCRERARMFAERLSGS
jgi:hypothetical protein